jgi:3-mercaptopyruvate sulfurtransferase SseA
MRTSMNFRWIGVLCGAVFALLSAGAILSHSHSASAAPARPRSAQSAEVNRPQTQQQDPWTVAQTVDPATLVKEISGPASQRPTIVSVSPHALYLGGHIPGAVYKGPGFSAAGIESLKQWARHLPRSTSLVVYCGCCPLVHCPNLRPAFRALQSMGFTHLRALILPTNFYTDWYAKGYPTDKGS